MKPKYTATDLFKLRKTLKLLAHIENMDSTLIDRCFENMLDGKSSRNLITLFTVHFKDFIDDKLPGLSKNMLKVIMELYKRKKERRNILRTHLEFLSLENRLLPLKRMVYEEFGKRSKTNFHVVCAVFSNHIYGKEK